MSSSYYDVESIGLGTVKKEAYNPTSHKDYMNERPFLFADWTYPTVVIKSEKTPSEISNPLGQSLQVTWQEGGTIQYRGCKDYEEAWKVYQENFTKPYVKMVKSVVLSHTELEALAYVEKVEKAEKAQRKLDEEAYLKLKEKLGY